MSSDGMSVAPSMLIAQNDELRQIKREMKGITDERKLKQYILEHNDQLIGLGTELLNSYHSCESAKISRRRNVLGVVKVQDNRYKTQTAMRSDIDRLKAVIERIVELNNLRVE
jgi:hypothetical protein